MMRRAIQGLGLVGVVCATASGQVADTSNATRRGEIRLGVTSVGATRFVAPTGAPMFAGTASLSGVEFLALGSAGGGILARYESGTVSGPVVNPAGGKVEVIDGRFLLGTRAFALVAGYVLRTSRIANCAPTCANPVTGEARKLGIARAGAQIGRFFEGAGFGVTIGGSYLRTIKPEKDDSLEMDGLEGETSIIYAPPKWPVYLQVGYRREIFNFKKEKAVLSREEHGKLVFGVGVQAGLSVR